MSEKEEQWTLTRICKSAKHKQILDESIYQLEKIYQKIDGEKVIKFEIEMEIKQLYEQNVTKMYNKCHVTNLEYKHYWRD